MTLAFTRKFKILPRRDGFLVPSALKYIQVRTVHQDQQCAKKETSAQCSDGLNVVGLP